MSSKHLPLPETPFAQAVLSLVERIGETLPPALPAPVRVFLAGAAAVHLYVPARLSTDVQAIFSRPLFLPLDLGTSWSDEDGRRHVLIWDPHYNPALGLLHPDYAGRAARIGTLGGGRIELCVLSPEDLVLTKIVRFAPEDQEDIACLSRAGLVRAGRVAAWARAALTGYVGVPGWVEQHLQAALKLIRKASAQPAPAAAEGTPTAD